jgi:predicted nucleic acid-binding protein
VTEAWLIDKSALVRLPINTDELWSRRFEQGLVHICAVTLLEFGHSARTAAEHARILNTPTIARAIIQWDLPIAVTQRAYEIQGLLAHAGHHRGPSVSDLLVAATAEAVGLTLLHVDKDFELIAAVTGQPLCRLS